ncbi:MULTISPECIES: recombinase family protein, partial [unclassified Streptomyces]|uniref:recombinase family protein n=1 Tax=unclassified Streptomyces TaxID=2593676 RepID=UPI00226EE25F
RTSPSCPFWSMSAMYARSGCVGNAAKVRGRAAIRRRSVLRNLIDLAKELQARGVDLVVLDQGIDTSTAVGRMFFQILGAVAEFEHALMSERTMDGLEAARARGRTGGQKPKLGPARSSWHARCTTPAN